MKMASSWVCVFIYLWTLIVPRCWMGRDLTFSRRSLRDKTGDMEEEVEDLNPEEGEVIAPKESVV